MLTFAEPEILGNHMEQWEYCLLWASPATTVVVKPDGEVESFSNNRQSGSSAGILTSLQADGWHTVAFNTEPTVDMTYLFKRRVQTRRMKAQPQHPTAYLQTPTPPPQPASSPQ